MNQSYEWDMPRLTQSRVPLRTSTTAGFEKPASLKSEFEIIKITFMGVFKKEALSSGCDQVYLFIYFAVVICMDYYYLLI